MTGFGTSMIRVAPLAAAAVAVAAVAGAAGCEEDGAVRSGAKSPSERALAAWKEAGMEVPPFEPLAGAGIGGGTCRSGVMQGLETVICTFPNADAAKSARAAGLTYVGETTGVALPAGDALLVVADRSKSDPSGKAINAIAKAFLAGMADQPAGKAKPEGGEAKNAAAGGEAKPAGGEAKPGGDEAKPGGDEQ